MIYAEQEKPWVVQIVAAALARNASLDEAFELADKVLERLGAPEPATEIVHDVNATAVRINLLPKVEEGPDPARAALEYKGKTTVINEAELFLLECFDGREVVHLDTIKRKVFLGGDLHVDTGTVADHLAYGKIRGLKRAFSRLGLPDAIGNQRGRGFFLRGVQIEGRGYQIRSENE